MRIWLDDIRPMPAGFTHWARTAAQAIEWLMTGTVEAISFDHDLWPNREFPNEKEETGYTVAQFIEIGAFQGDLPPLNWGVHSSNPAGRQNIIAAMLQAEKFWQGHKWSFETRKRD